MAIVIGDEERIRGKDDDSMTPAQMLGAVFMVMTGVLLILFLATDLGQMERERLAKKPLRHESTFSRSLQDDIQNDFEVMRLSGR